MRIGVAVAGISAILGFATLRGNNPYFATAKDAARWIESTAVVSADGLTWPADPADPKSVNRTLYAGTPGPILFFLEMSRYTHDVRCLIEARKGADALLDSMRADEQACTTASNSTAGKTDTDTACETGLYEGVAGTGFTLGETYLFTHDKKYLDGAWKSVELLKSRAKKAGSGVEWDSGTDIIAGSAGTGLFLLWADKELKVPGAHDLAIRAGQRLIETGESKGAGKTSWLMDPKYPEMPNFSHGTAGVAYFLATLYLETKREEFLDAALRGANYLISIADTQGAICLIYHDANHKDLYYLNWCHGPAGVARLFYQLYRATQDPQWLDWMKRSAKAMVASGAPDKVATPGDWNNVGACCGVTAQAEFFLDMYLITKQREYLELARKATDRLVRAATRDEKGARWVQAEHRVKPELTIAQTGYMQGASGVGMWLLHMGAFSAGLKQPALKLPDNPFPY